MTICRYENKSPTREEAREWFRKHRNICRCTGYKPLVDSVMEAAKVMRGEATMEDISYDFAGEKDIYGSRHPRPSALAKVTGLADYGNDVERQMPEGVGPWEFRYKNAARPGDLTINSRPYHDYLYPKLLEMAKPTYDKYKAEAEAAKKEGRHVGVGMSMGSFVITIGAWDHAEVALELNPDGTITHFNTWQDVGQGGDIGTLTHTVKALEPLGIRAKQVRLVMNDSKKCPDTLLSYMAGNATLDAAKQLMDAMRKKDGTYRTYAEMVAEGIPTKYVWRLTYSSNP